MATESLKNRLETFSDGVFAIAITLLVLEIKIPPIDSVHTSSQFWHEILHEWPSWFGFALSFAIILVSWVGHRDILNLVSKSSAAFTYANGFLLFTVAVFPFTTHLMAEYMLTDFAQQAITIYCFSILVHSLSWFAVHRTMLHPIPLTKDDTCRTLVEKHLVKNNYYALSFYFALSILSFWFPFVSMVLMTASWALWIVAIIKMNPVKEHLDSQKK